MKILKEKFDGKDIILLTNGKRFSDFDFTKKFIEIGLKNIIPCISLHSDIDKIHDEIVGVKGSYKLTIKGIYNLAKFICPIEIRYVINKLNYSRLYYFAEFSYRNFPFVFHFAFMELEVTGNAVENYEQIWIDPYDYRDLLESAILELNRRNMNVSIYNIPHCLLNKKVWRFARKSISEWKNKYLDVCKDCELISECCGVFSTSGKFQSKNIHSIKNFY